MWFCTCHRNLNLVFCAALASKHGPIKPINANRSSVMVLVSPGRLVWRASSHAYILKEPYRPPACMLTDCGGLFSEFFVILYLFRLYGGNAQLPCLLLLDDFAAAIACVVVCFVRMARLPSPQLGLLLDGLTSYPLPCLTLPVRWGSKMNPICQ